MSTFTTPAPVLRPNQAQPVLPPLLQINPHKDDLGPGSTVTRMEVAKSLMALADRITKSLTNLYAGIPLQGWRYFDTLSLDGTNPLRIRHGMMRPYLGWILCGQSDPARIWEVVDDALTYTTTKPSSSRGAELVLMSDAPTRIRVLIF